MVTPYVNGEKHGEWTLTGPDGKKVLIGQYVNGELQE